ncbi:hypothetical protein T4B_3592 [Trichinella pseudospiralis]|uniref:Uncharacterized protein n=1 Tax=Trichinella pseudospiralis TaxID=6337 RepID=A0A0V1JKZ0_TRIPS|nr:hypothetical protein T4B_3592 [Trichinella pseudospiralis]KRZ35579.1 hypothetical protein T4C_7871 [Trichinella pseudospiralis]KRZ35615.1 hypothetical protein T4C_12656 [Trichinella pseudospiralis]
MPYSKYIMRNYAKPAFMSSLQHVAFRLPLTVEADSNKQHSIRSPQSEVTLRPLQRFATIWNKTINVRNGL